MINEQALKDRLHTIAKEKDIQFNACWKQLLLERFLSRLARSSHSNKFIFKGGFLLAYMMKIGRETTDLDFLLTRMKAEEKEVQQILEQIISIPSEDGFAFSFDGIELLAQPHMDYPGYRVTLKTTFVKMRDKIQIDVGVGDIVEPKNLKIKLFQYRGKPFFEDSISLLVYPIETIFAEKLETVISKGAGNSRMKDYHDLFLLIRDQELSGSKKLKEATLKTFANRETTLQVLQFDEADFKTLQPLWTAHLHALGSAAQDLNLPTEIQVIVSEINNTIRRIMSLS
jgi:predicted nucleotidyltransferase component of viral defense system